MFSADALRGFHMVNLHHLDTMIVYETLNDSFIMKMLYSIILFSCLAWVSTSTAQQICSEGEIQVTTPTGQVSFKDQTGNFDPFTYSIFHNNGNLRFNLNTPAGPTDNLRHNGANLYVGENVMGPGPRLYVGSAGDGSSAIANSYMMYSDRRLKTDIYSLNRSQNNILKLRPVTYTWKQSELTDVGFVAQELAEVFPKLVQTDADTGIQHVDYVRLIPYLVDALQQQNEEIKALNLEINKLK